MVFLLRLLCVQRVRGARFNTPPLCFHAAAGPPSLGKRRAQRRAAARFAHARVLVRGGAALHARATSGPSQPLSLSHPLSSLCVALSPLALALALRCDGPAARNRASQLDSCPSALNAGAVVVVWCVSVLQFAWSDSSPACLRACAWLQPLALLSFANGAPRDPEDRMGFNAVV